MSRTIKTKLAGVTHLNDEDGSDRQALIRRRVRAGMELTARHEPDNPEDSNAVGVWVQDGFPHHRRVGFLSRDLAGDLAPVFRRGGSLRVRVLATTGGGLGQSVGVNVEVLAVDPAPQAPPAEPFDWGPLRAGLVEALEWSYRVAAAGVRSLPDVYRSLVSTYQGLPAWARPVVWGVAIAAPLVLAMFAVRWLLG